MDRVSFVSNESDDLLEKQSENYTSDHNGNDVTHVFGNLTFIFAASRLISQFTVGDEVTSL